MSLLQCVPMGVGNVIGPAVHLDNFLPRWDGDNTQTLQTSNIYVDDDGNMGVNTTTIQSWGASVGFIQLGDDLSIVAFPAFNTVGMAQGMYYDGSDWRYTVTGVPASVCDLNSGYVVLHTTTAGTVGNVINTWKSMYLDPNGNIGLDVVPDAYWWSSLRAIQIGGDATLGATKAAGAGGSFYIGQNVFIDSDPNYTYLDADEASLYTQTAGTHGFYVAAAGSQFGTISFSTGLRILNNTNVGIGVYTPTARLHLQAGTATVGTAPIKLTSGTLLSTVEAGTVEYDGNRIYLTNKCVRRGIDTSCSGNIDNTNISNTTAETTMYTCPIPANCLSAGNHIHIEASGVISNDSVSDDITIRVYVGTDLINEYNPAIGNVTNANWHIELHTTINSIGALGTMASHGHVEIDGNEDIANELDSVDTTTSNDITVTVQWDNAKAGNIISLYQATSHFSV